MVSASSTSPRNAVDLRATRVVVEGPTTEESPRVVTYISCHLYLYFDTASKAAFFKLRLPLAPEDNLLVYIFIDPDQVDSLSLDRATSKNADLARLCGSSAPGTVCLRFSLRRPASIVGPTQCRPQAGHVDASVLGHIQFLAAQTTIAVHIPQGDVSTAQLQALSSAASVGLLTSSAPHASLSRMYGGRSGGALPSYDEVAGPSKPSSEGSRQGHSPIPSKKRRLESPTPEPGAEAGADEKAALAQQRSEQLRGQMRDLIRDVFREDMVEDVRKVVCAELEKTEARIMSHVAEQIDQLRDEVTERIDEAMAEAVSRNDLEDVVDDRAAGMKIEMEDFVKDEMRGVEDKILDHFENGTWYGSFRRPEDL
ncbi:hypothetical protein M406DRAFT_352659 [Cryphonectria parasitica EP155]|uniref:Uncharacterized protein n=1 Tax=Cryphonectria parasitica (strain ATCC 38755 / EP155) TaxID=660469 RepID=A0A9P4XWI0_CRYP1|nr:uncharacterized protein M406DRAFT_352659 [Cryphonectria parasitica EP155]KAF3762239.1 hypothetical protein M406DRAFT_352659 [Cryphonectria parasitica EP155]